MRFIVAITIHLLVSHGLWAKTLPPTLESLKDLMQDSRDPIITSSSRLNYLQFTHKHLRALYAKELNVSPGLLLQTPLDKTLLAQEAWKNVLTEFYTTLHQEAYTAEWMKQSKEKKITSYGENLYQSMLINLGSFSLIKEGKSYSRWSEITGVGKAPYFVVSDKTQDLLQIEAHIPFEKLFPKETNASSGNPSLATFLRQAGENKRPTYQTMAEKIQLNHRIYLRAVANGAKTIGSVNYLTGVYSLSETEQKVSKFVEMYCEGCSVTEKDEYTNGAIDFIKKSKSTMHRQYRGSDDIVTTFCTDLRHNFYQFPEPEEKKTERDLWLRDSQVAVQDNTRVDQTPIINRMRLMNLTAVQKVVAEHELGVLFLTRSLTRLSSDHHPYDTALGCRPDSSKLDNASVILAIAEAARNVEQYIAQVNQKIKSSTHSMKEIDETLEYFTQTNVASTSEALMTFPQGFKHTVKSILTLDSDVKRRKRIDTIVSWGGTIVGLALTVSGVGAPEGVALLLTVGAMTKGAISGSYNLYRSRQEKAFYDELSVARRGLGTHFYLDANSSQHYADYRSLRLNYIMDFSGAIFSFAKIHAFALGKAGGDLPKANSMIKLSMERLKASGQDVAQDQLTQMILQMGMN